MGRRGAALVACAAVEEHSPTSIKGGHAGQGSTRPVVWLGRRSPGVVRTWPPEEPRASVMAGGAEGDGRAAVWVAAAAGWAAGAMYGCSVALTISYVNALFDGDALDWLSFM